jgi:hypothetical protein
VDVSIEEDIREEHTFNPRRVVLNNDNNLNVVQGGGSEFSLRAVRKMFEMSHIVESFMRLEFQPIDVHVKNVDKINKM